MSVFKKINVFEKLATIGQRSDFLKKLSQEITMPQMTVNAPPADVVKPTSATAIDTMYGTNVSKTTNLLDNQKQTSLTDTTDVKNIVIKLKQGMEQILNIINSSNPDDELAPVKALKQYINDEVAKLKDGLSFATLNTIQTIVKQTLVMFMTYTRYARAPYSGIASIARFLINEINKLSQEKQSTASYLETKYKIIK